MITMKECANYAGIALYEVPVRAIPSARHKRLFRSYLLNLERGEKAVSRMIAEDLRRNMELGAHERAADLLHVLRLFLCSCSHRASVARALRRSAKGKAARP